MSEFKPAGLCPYCRKMVRAQVEEKNKFRRDVCKCPNCGGRILVCRAPGCKDYAEGSKSYDQELCPSCTKSNFKFIKSAAGLAIGVVIAIFTGGRISK